MKFDSDVIYSDNKKYLETFDLIIYCLILTKAPYFYINKTRIYYDDLCRDLKIGVTTQNRIKIQSALQTIHDKKILEIHSDKKISKIFFEIDFRDIFEYEENKHFVKIYYYDLFKIFDFVELKNRKAFHLYINLLIRNNFSKFLLKDHSVQFLAEVLNCDKRTCQRAIQILIDNRLIVQQHNGERSENNKEVSSYLVFNQKNTYIDYAEIYHNFYDLIKENKKGITKNQKVISEELKQNEVINYLKKYRVAHNRKDNIYLAEILRKKLDETRGLPF